MTHLQTHLSTARLTKQKEYATKPPTSPEKPLINPYSLEGISDALSNILALSASGICRMLNGKRRWPKLNTTVAVADFLGVCPDMVFELARKDMQVEMEQGRIK